MKCFCVQKTSFGRPFGTIAPRTRSLSLTHQKLQECHMCMSLYRPRELIYAMTLKMIYATECHLKVIKTGSVVNK